MLVRGRSPLDEAAIWWRIWPSVQEVDCKAVVPVGQRLEEAVRSHCAEDAYDGNGAGIIGPRRLGKIGEPRRGVVAPQEHALRTAGDRCAVRIERAGINGGIGETIGAGSHYDIGAKSDGSQI